MNIKKLNEKLEKLLETQDKTSEEAARLKSAIKNFILENKEQLKLGNYPNLQKAVIELDAIIKGDVSDITGLKDKRKLNTGETKIPTETDLDEIYDAINTLNKCEWFVNNQDDVDILIKAYKVLEKILKENEEDE